MRWSFVGRAMAVGALALSALGRSGAAQGTTGTVTGTVTSAETKLPLADVRVQVVGTLSGAVTSAQGTYRLNQVPAGQVTLSFTRVGYKAARTKVTIVGGQATNHDEALNETTVKLSEVVITGTAGNQERRAQSAVVASVDAATITENATISTIGELLTARTPGVAISRASGSVGTANQIRIRGNASISLSNQPLVFVDGVRVAEGAAFTTAGGGSVLNGQVTDRLNDINPDDIESIEIVKGPAAASLYGADASAGVIQIITKRGKIGSQSFQQSVRYEYGSVDPSWTPPSNFANCAASQVVVGSTNPLCVGKVGTTTVAGVTTLGTLVSDNPLVRTNAFRTGNDRIVSWNGKGGGQNYSFFLAGTADANIGTLPNNSLERYNGRANFQITPNEQWRVDVNVGFIRSKTQLPDNDNNIYGFLGGGLLGTPNQRDTSGAASADGWFGFARQVGAISSITNTQLTNRGIFGVVTNYAPLPWFTNRLTLGADLIRDEFTRFFPRNAIGQYAAALNLGSNTQTRNGFERYTVDYLGDMRGTWGAQSQWETHVSFGAQTISTRNESLGATGVGFVVNTNPTVGSAASTSGTQNYAEQTQFGLFGQLQVAYRNRVILTFAERADKFSSFGRPDDAFYLPKLGISYVIGDESWFRLPGVSNARLRASWGQTGRTPGAGASLQTYTSAPYAITASASAPGAIPLNPGNSNLKAERGEEYEMGADFGIVKDRVNFELTYFKKTTKDLLLQVPLSPSLAFTTNPFQNIGGVENSGFEFAINAQMYRSPNFAWDLRASMSTLENTVTDLGAIKPFFVGNVGQVKVGQPIGAQVSKRILSIDTVAKTVLVDSGFRMINQPLPGFEAALFNSIRIGKWVTVSGSIDTKRGFGIYNLTNYFRETQLVRSDDRLNLTKLSTYERLRRYGAPTGPAFNVLGGGTETVGNVNEAFIEAGDFVRFRELAVAIQIPNVWARKIRASGGSFTIAANNLAVWSDYKGADPEVITNIQSQFDRTDFLTVPSAKRVTFRFNLQY